MNARGIPPAVQQVLGGEGEYLPWGTPSPILTTWLGGEGVPTLDGEGGTYLGQGEGVPTLGYSPPSCPGQEGEGILTLDGGGGIPILGYIPVLT